MHLSRSRRLPGLLFLLTSLLAGTGRTAPSGLPDHVPGEVLVRFAPDAAKADREAVLRGLGATAVRTFPRIGVQQLRIAGLDVAEALRRFRGHPGLLYIEPNFHIRLCRLPDDPHLAEQWGLINSGQTGGTIGADVGAAFAWDSATASGEVLVAIIDSGVEIDHPDLAPNIYTNPGEIPGNGQDDDGNGFPDDVHGWNSLGQSGDVTDMDGHGTAIAGIIGAVGDNGVGVAGLTWDVQIVPVKWTQHVIGNIADLVAGVLYVVELGVDIVNCSFGWGGTSDALRDAFAALQADGVLAVCAAGNQGQDVDLGLPFYPASYDFDNIVTVAATDDDDRLATFSNRGGTSIDLAAPGQFIFSTDLGGSYGLYLDITGGSHGTGTSFAAPFVAGGLALLLGLHPELTPAEARAQVLATADPLPGLADLLVSGGRLDLYELIAGEDRVPPAAVTDLATAEVASNWVRLSWTANGDDQIYGRASAYDIRFATFPLDPESFADATPVPDPPAPANSGSPETFVVTGLAQDTEYHFALVVVDDAGNASPPSNVILARTLGAPAIAVSPAAVDTTLLYGEDALPRLELANAGPGVLDFELVATPEVPWLVAAPAAGHLQAGESLEAVLGLFTGGLTGGVFETVLAVRSNDPARPEIPVPVSLTVACEPDIALAPLSLDFGAVGIERSATRSFTIFNRNCDPLEITEIRALPGVFDTGAAPLTLAQGESTSVTVSFAPVDTAQAVGVVLIGSNDPDQPQTQVTLRGRGVYLPEIAVSPGELVVELSDEADTASVAVTVTNVGLADLDFTVERRASTRLVFDRILLLEEFPAGVATLPALYDTALSRLGLERVAVSSWAELGDSLVAGAPWDLAVINGHTRTQVAAPAAEALSAHLLGGGRVLYHDTRFSFYTGGLWPFFEELGILATGASQSPPMNVLPLVPEHPIFTSPQTVGVLQGVPDPYVEHNFEQVYLLNGGHRELADFEYFDRYSAIVLNRTRRGLFNAFYAPTCGVTDGDLDGELDVVELIQNEIDHLATAASWFAVDSEGGRLAPGAGQELRVSFDARYLDDGEYRGELLLGHNDPGVPAAVVTVILRVSRAAPELQPDRREVAPVWSLVGFPLAPPAGSATLGDVLLDDVTGRSWLFGHTPDAGYATVAADAPATPGCGYWLATESAFTWTMTGTRALGEVRIPLAPGWNLVGYPLWFTGPLSGLRVADGEAELDLDAAVDAGLLAAEVLGWDTAGEAYAPAGELAAWHGYWFAALVPGQSLVFDYRHFLAAPVRIAATRTAAAAPSDWSLTVGIAGRPERLTLGEQSGAGDGFDPRWDAPAPPDAPESAPRARLRFRRPGWRVPTGDAFVTDLRAPADAPRCWTAELAVPAPGLLVLAWDAAALPAGRDLQLHLPSRGQLAVASLRDASRLEIEVEAGILPLEFRTPDHAGETPAALPLGLRNVPNPANPGTEFRFHLRAPGRVEVAIHDLRGALVRRLDAGRREAGPCRVHWDGRDRRGRPAASGSYVFRLLLDGRRLGDARKLSLVK